MTDAIEYRARIGQAIDAIETREDLADVLGALDSGCSDGVFGRLSVTDYLEGIRTFIADLDSRAKARGQTVPEQPTWRWLGRIAYGAFGDGEGAG